MENEKGLWTAKDTASHMRYSYGTFRNKLAAEVKDNIPSEKSELPPFHWIMKHRRWIPAEVAEWVKAHPGK